MNWNAVYAESAAADLLRLPVPLQSMTLDHVDKLSESPSTHARVCPANMGPPNHMLSEFSHVLDGRLHLVRILFRFDSNEQDFHIKGIGHVAYKRADEA
ncbi:MAG: hypothetical protein R3C19_17975 [Planctomycetaceae bacterium]